MAISLPKPSIHASPGEKLRYYRELKQLNQEEISRILGHESIWYIVNLEKGFNPIFYEDAVKLAGVLDIDPDDLLTEYTRFCRPGYGERIKRIRYEYRMSQAEFA
ncbi:MAG: helix-turn-helix transcriptional regulator, partial [Solobacterium sp.]|nr:helix-turn-helix transcriptional regulator [Solobacterium sp.]